MHSATQINVIIMEIIITETEITLNYYVHSYLKLYRLVLHAFPPSNSKRKNFTYVKNQIKSCKSYEKKN